MEKVFISWSGGKDSCFAAYLAAQSGLEVSHLVTMLAEDGQHSGFHELTIELLDLQSQAIGIPLVKQRAGEGTYKKDFTDVILALKKEGVSGGVFGDIDLEEHREWVEQLCREVGISPHLPLWGKSQDQVLKDFTGLGFESVIVLARADLFGEEWLGRKVDQEFIDYLEGLGDKVTPCGEAGEYHTFVVDGPLFKQRIEIGEATRTKRDKHWFLDIAGGELSEK